MNIGPHHDDSSVPSEAHICSFQDYAHLVVTQVFFGRAKEAPRNFQNIFGDLIISLLPWRVSLGAERDGIIAFLTERRAVSVSAIVATYLGKLDVSGIKAALLAIKSGQLV
jgi:hypothetical protein